MNDKFEDIVSSLELDTDKPLETLAISSWTAEDFARIYTRFRPQLVVHARKYLSNSVQVEDVVQEAFLYLMLSMPEVDSELGALRLLKWKVKLLAFDVIAASKKTTVMDPVQAEELSPQVEDEVADDLIRADEAAIVQLALSKLDSRQREALVASIYEEKSTREVAEQLAVSDNAAKQLLHRARKSLKVALVGELNTQGLSLGEIISVATRKAAAEARNNVARALSVFAIIGLGLAGWLGMTGNQVQEQLSLPISVESNEPAVPETEVSTESGAATETTPESNTEAEALPSQSAPASNDAEPASESENLVFPEESSPQPANLESSLASQDPRIDRSPFNAWLVDSILEQDLQVEFTRISQEAGAKTAHTVAATAGVWSDVYFDYGSSDPVAARIGFMVGSDQYFANLKAVDLYVSSDGDIDIFKYIGEVQAVTNVSGQSFEETRMAGTQFAISVHFDNSTGNVSAVDFDRVDPS